MKHFVRVLLTMVLTLSLLMSTMHNGIHAAAVEEDGSVSSVAGEVQAAAHRAKQVSQEDVTTVYTGYISLDTDEAQKITFDGETVTWGGKEWTLDEYTLFLDYRLDEAQIADNPYAFNDVVEAFDAVKNGTADKPMMLLVAPGVYWVEEPYDPNDPNAYKNGVNGVPITGYTFKQADYLWFYGLTDDAENVVIACNRGQQMGCEGNYTMIGFPVSYNWALYPNPGWMAGPKGLRSSNITFGNYCNVDLEFPLDESLNYPKQSAAHTQAQLFSNGSDAYCENTSFISRLNLCPLTGYYKDCHFELAGHSGAGSCFVNCDFELYSGNVSASNYYFNCDFLICPDPSRLTGLENNTFKVSLMDAVAVSNMACVDVRFARSEEMKAAGINADITWDRNPQSPLCRDYQYNVTMDGEPYVIQEAYTPGVSVRLEDNEDLLKAFRLTDGEDVWYNVYNLTGQDPYGFKEAIEAYAESQGLSADAFFNIPYSASLSLSTATIQSGKDTATATFTCSKADSDWLGEWFVETAYPEDAQYVNITMNDDGTATIAGANDTENAVTVVIEARNELGIEAAKELTVQPSYVDAPGFLSGPTVRFDKGRLVLDYELDMGIDTRVDQSLITWYRCSDANGSDPVAVAVTRRDDPTDVYTLTMADVGHYIMAGIQPKHNRCDPGEEVFAVYPSVITTADVQVLDLYTNFQDVVIEPRPEVYGDIWSFDGYSPAECVKDPFTATDDSWTYAKGKDGCIGLMGLVPTARGARIYYEPTGGKFENMKVAVTLAPCKDGGQGFGSATNQFVDVFIKYDKATLTGYALRLERLTKDDIIALGWDGDGAVAGVVCYLIKYENGEPTPISEKVMTSAFLTLCTVDLEAKDGTLSATVSSTKPEEERSGTQYGYVGTVHLSAEYEENGFGGSGLIFTGTTRWTLETNANFVMVYDYSASWEPVVSCDKETLDFGEVEAGGSSTAVVNLAGSKLDGKIQWETDNDDFTVEFGEDFDDYLGGEAIIKFTPSSEESDGTGTITFYGGTSDRVTLTVSGTQEHVHDWGEPVFEWSDDYSTCTATFTCQSDPSHVETVEAEVTSETTPATTAMPGKTVYTATVEGPDGVVYTDEKTVVIPQIVVSGPDVSITAKSKDGFTLKWDPVDSATKYEVYCQVGEGEWTLLQTTTETELTTGKLVMGTAYQYKVRAYITDSNGDSAWTPYGGEAQARFNPFKDVSDNASYFKALSWAFNNNIIGGTTATKFSPNDNCTRQQFAAMLWKLKGKQSTEGMTNPFKDVSETNTFRNPIVWCYHEGIVAGTSATTFSPKTNINRWQIAVMLWRMVGKPTVEGENPFTDVKTTDAYYKAVHWAYRNGITKVETFRPQEKCSRWQLVVFLYKLNNIYHFIQ